MKKIGAFVGKFYPPHIGHLSVIDNALEKFDEIYVIISKNSIRDKEIEKNQKFEMLNTNLIKKWFKKHYKNNPKVKVEIFDESGLRPYPEDRYIWAEKFKKQFPTVNTKIADAEYREYNEKYFPEYEFFEIDRDKLPIHSTMIRKDIQSNIEYLIPEAKNYFEKVVLRKINTKFNESKNNDKLNTSYPIKPDDWKPYKSNKVLSFDDEKLCLSFHIPFCKALCKFCEYIKFAKKNNEEEKHYIDCMLSDAKKFLIEHKDKTIYGLDIGGGTPTVLDDENFEYLLSEIDKMVKPFKKSNDFLPSIEATFETINETKLKVMKKYNFKRISFGIQTFDKNILKMNNRENGSLSHIKEVFNMCRKYGIEIINLDVMYGLKNQNKSDLISTLKVVDYLKPEHITFYEFRTNILGVKENNTKNELFNEYKTLYYTAMKMGYKGRFGQNTFSKLSDKGLSSYLENRMLNFINYKGFGISAQSKGDNGLSYNYGKNHEIYKECFDNNSIKCGDCYILPNQELLNKYLAVSGYYGSFNIDVASNILKKSFCDSYKYTLKYLTDRNLIREEKNRIYITKKGFKYYGAITSLFYKKEIIQGSIYGKI